MPGGRQSRGRNESEISERPCIIWVCGLKREARLLSKFDKVLVGARDLPMSLQQTSSAVISFGLCGALDPALQPGDLVIGTGVGLGGRRLAADVDWLTRLTRAFPHAALGAVAGSNVIVGSAAAKAELRAATGAIAADMESHAVAAAARDFGVPFAILRAVSDGAAETLPLSAQAGFRPDGSTDIAAVMRGLIARPAELPALIRTARNAAKGFAALRRAVAAWPRDVRV